MNELYTTRELAEMLKVHENTIYNWRKEGLPVRMFGKSVRFDLEEVSEWAKSKQESEKEKVN